MSGSWGGDPILVSSTTCLETLTTLDPCLASVAAGGAWLAAEQSANHDSLARQAGGLAWIPGREATARSLALVLLAARNPAASDSGLPNWPEGGWGIDAGYETDVLTTALAMLALDRNGLNGGFSATNVALAGGATKVHTWFIPSDASKAHIQITVTGSTVRLRMKQGSPPTVADPFFALPPGGPYLLVFPDSGIPLTPGTNYISVQSPAPPALPATYTMTASYQTPDLDTRTLAEPLAYLRQSQNIDGGWGLQRGQPSDLYTTLHALLAVLRFSQYEFAAAKSSSVAYIKTQQFPNGSFGYDGQPVSFVTALAALGLVRAESPSFSTDTQEAVTALLALQDPDGSWDQQTYDTALAVLAAWEYVIPPTAEAGADRTLTDLNGSCGESVTLAGSGSDANGTIQGYAWADACSPIASGATPTVSLSVGTHVLLLTATDNTGYTGRDRVWITVLDGGFDDDFDGFLKCSGDCNDANGLVWAVPGEARNLRFTSHNSLAWDLPVELGAVVVAHDLLRSTVRSDFVTAAVCLESDDTANTQATDTAVPAISGVFYYLSRAQNNCPAGQGPLGYTSAGAPITGRNCP